jgi:hypothetical protein
VLSFYEVWQGFIIYHHSVVNIWTIDSSHGFWIIEVPCNMDSRQWTCAWLESILFSISYLFFVTNEVPTLADFLDSRVSAIDIQDFKSKIALPWTPSLLFRMISFRIYVLKYVFLCLNVISP